MLPAFDMATAQTVVDRQNGDLSLPGKFKSLQTFPERLILTFE
jgi:hypothetical protein